MGPYISEPYSKNGGSMKIDVPVWFCVIIGLTMATILISIGVRCVYTNQSITECCNAGHHPTETPTIMTGQNGSVTQEEPNARQASPVVVAEDLAEPNWVEEIVVSVPKEERPAVAYRFSVDYNLRPSYTSVKK